MREAITLVIESQALFLFCVWLITPLLARSKKHTLWFFAAKGMIWLDAIQWQLMETGLAAARHFLAQLPERWEVSKREVGV